MTLLAIAQAVAKNAGIEVPASITNSDPDHILLVQFINEAGAEVARRVDWGVLRKTATLTGDGAAKVFDLPADFDRFGIGLSVMGGDGAVRGSLTADEWFMLEPAVGAPRYYYLQGAKISLYPFLKAADTARIQYQSKNWTSAGAKMTVGTDTPIIPGALLESGALWRWRRHVGKSYADHVGEFEAQLVDLARNDSGVRLP